MSEATPGAAAIIEQPLTPEVAAQQMDVLKADPKFMERVASKDAAAFNEFNRLWRISRGLPETPQPQSAAEINAETDARVVAAVQQHAAVLGSLGYNEELQTVILGRRPVPQAEHDMHVSLYERYRKDAAFMARWSAGDMEAIKIMRDHAIGKSLPIGTLQQINDWERARGLPLSK
jgi:hypothetical protein